MEPSLLSGDKVLSLRTRVKEKDVVIVSTENFGLVVKRILFIKQNKVYLSGDNPRLDSSICSSPVELEDIMGKVILNLTALIIRRKKDSTSVNNQHKL